VFDRGRSLLSAVESVFVRALRAAVRSNGDDAARRRQNGRKRSTPRTVVKSVPVVTRVRLLATLPGMRPRAPRRNVLVGLLYAILAGLALLLLWTNVQSLP
jgi:hypothetical protein